VAFTAGQRDDFGPAVRIGDQMDFGIAPAAARSDRARSGRLKLRERRPGRQSTLRILAFRNCIAEAAQRGAFPACVHGVGSVEGCPMQRLLLRDRPS
jgi:hypothetical protein